MQSNTILEKVKEFLVRLAKDSAFATQLQTNPIDQVQTLLHQAGYTFSNEEFETATIQLLDLKERDEFHELTEDELVAAIGGWMRGYPRPYPRPCSFPCPNPYPIQPMYGVIVEPPENEDPRPKPKPLPYPYPQPMYGVVISPPTDIQPMYGVIISPEDM